MRCQEEEQIDSVQFDSQSLSSIIYVCNWLLINYLSGNTAIIELRNR